jgi:hypothetical protein
MSPILLEAPSSAGFYQLESPRSARLYVPSRYDGQTPLPLVLVLHGFVQPPSGIPDSVESYFQMKPLTEARGFYLCCPEGTLDRQGNVFWNATDGDFLGQKEQRAKGREPRVGDGDRVGVEGAVVVLSASFCVICGQAERCECAQRRIPQTTCLRPAGTQAPTTEGLTGASCSGKSPASRPYASARHSWPCEHSRSRLRFRHEQS